MQKSYKGSSCASENTQTRPHFPSCKHAGAAVPSKTAQELSLLLPQQHLVELLGQHFKPNEHITLYDVIHRVGTTDDALRIICSGLLPAGLLGYTSGEKFYFGFRRDLCVGPTLFNVFLQEIDKWKEAQA